MSKMSELAMGQENGTVWWMNLTHGVAYPAFLGKEGVWHPCGVTRPVELIELDCVKMGEDYYLTSKDKLGDLIRLIKIPEMNTKKGDIEDMEDFKGYVSVEELHERW
jgi:hypothetical protein